MPPVQLRQFLQSLVTRPVRKGECLRDYIWCKGRFKSGPRKRKSRKHLSPARSFKGECRRNYIVNLKVAGSIRATCETGRVAQLGEHEAAFRQTLVARLL